MIMGARHHFWGSGCVPHRINMTRRWGPVGLMRVGGMGQMAPSPWGTGSGFNTPSGFIPVTSIVPFHAPTALPSPATPLQSPYRYRGLGQVALNSPIVTGQSSSTSNQANVLAAANAAIKSGYTGFITTGYSGPISTPSGAVVNVNLSLQQLNDALMKTWGQPRAPVGVGFEGSGYAQNVLQFIGNGTLQYDPTTDQWNVCSINCKAPTAASVVNPSPSTQLTTTGSRTTAPGSAVSQANGTVAVPGATASTVGGTVSTTDTSGQIVTGLPNWVLFVAGGVALVLLTRK